MEQMEKTAVKSSGWLMKKLIAFVGLPCILLFAALLIIVAAASQMLGNDTAAVAGGRMLSDMQNTEQVTDQVGKATYVGVDDTDTELSRKVLASVNRWSTGLPPFYDGYAGKCESWVYDVYTAAGLPSSGTCCAYHHGDLVAHKDGAIPKGALIFSGVVPSTGQLYENNHRESAFCDVCKHYAGHVAIYIGNGMIAGAQVPYLQSVDTWIQVYGYGGWGLS